MELIEIYESKSLTEEEKMRKMSTMIYLTKELTKGNVDNIKFLHDNTVMSGYNSVMNYFLDPFSKCANSTINTLMSINEVDNYITDFGNISGVHERHFELGTVYRYLSMSPYPLICIYLNFQEPKEKIIVPIVKEKTCIYIPDYILEKYTVQFYTSILKKDLMDFTARNCRVYYWRTDIYQYELSATHTSSDIIKHLRKGLYENLVYSLQLLYSRSTEYITEILDKYIDRAENIVDALISTIKILSCGLYYGKLEYTNNCYNMLAYISSKEDNTCIISSNIEDICILFHNNKIYKIGTDGATIEECYNDNFMKGKIDFAIKIMPS